MKNNDVENNDDDIIMPIIIKYLANYGDKLFYGLHFSVLSTPLTDLSKKQRKYILKEANRVIDKLVDDFNFESLFEENPFFLDADAPVNSRAMYMQLVRPAKLVNDEKLYLTLRHTKKSSVLFYMSRYTHKKVQREKNGQSEELISKEAPQRF